VHLPEGANRKTIQAYLQRTLPKPRSARPRAQQRSDTSRRPTSIQNIRSKISTG
jgi:hypothetical protein